MSQANEKILLTLPRSKQLRPLIPLILANLPGASLRLAVSGSGEDFTRKTDDLLASIPTAQRIRVECVECDLTNFAQVKAAVAGATVIIHNGPGMHPLESEMGLNVVTASSEPGSSVKHFIFCSVIHPLRVKMTNHAAKLPVEERLIESGLGYTILRPTHVMQNLNLKAILETHKISIPYDPTVLHGFVDLSDLQEVIMSVLQNPEKHNRATYELVGTNGTYDDAVVGAFATVTGDKFEVQQVAADDQKLKAMGMATPYQREACRRMLFYYTFRGLPGNSNVLGMLLGREPTDWVAFLQRELPKLSK